MDFDQYHKNQQILSQITRHTTSSIKILQTKIVQWNDSTEKELEKDLDLIHFIFKHGRACSSSFYSACAAQLLYPQLAQLIINQANDEKITTLSYSLLICMIDLIKHDSLSSFSTSQSIQFISIACPLWSHHKVYICRKSMELCCRLLSRINDNESSIIVDKLILYIQQCRAQMTRADIEKIRSHEYTEFYFNSDNSSTMVHDRSTIRWLIQIIFAVFLKQAENHLSLIKEIKGKSEWPVLGSNVNLQCLDLYLHNHIYDPKELLFDICCANDDDTVQLLDNVLSIYQQQRQDNALFLSTIDINPHTVFLFFIQRCGNTHDILVDLLLENDSGFITYFHRYIIYATQHIESFKKSNSDLGNDLDTIQTIIANTLLVLEGNGFPYNAKPLIRRLTLFEENLFA